MAEEPVKTSDLPERKNDATKDGHPSVNNPLSKKLNKILESRVDNDKDVLDALKSLSEFFTENNIRTRRNLRSDIEKRALEINKNFITSFASVKEQLDGICKDVEDINTCCQDMTSRLKKTKNQTRDLINQTTKLQGESQKIQLRSQIVELFLAKFQLKQEEIQALKGGRDGQLHQDFFDALQRVKEIHEDCKILLRTNHQTTGLELMESMAMHQEVAYEKLYRWTQNECCLLTNDAPDVNNKLCQAVEALQDRPVLFKYSLDEFGNARRASVVRGFIDALTRGGPGGNPRPIELHSHDPLRYLGDMLAWIHQAIASEKEHAHALLKNCNKIVMEDTVHEMLKLITEGICRPLKVRIEQVLTSEPGPKVLYKLTNLLQFYIVTNSQILSTSCVLLHTLDEMFQLSQKLFFSSLSFTTNKLMEKVELPPPDLSPSTSLHRMLQLLQDILSSDDSLVIGVEEKKKVFGQILVSLIDPLIQMSSLSASQLSVVDMATYMINSLYTIHCTIALYEFTDKHLEMLKAQIDAHLDTLTGEQTSFVLSNCGLALLCTSLQQANQEPLSKIPGMDVVSIRSSMSKFDGYLSKPDSLLLPQCSQILSSKFREVIKQRSTELICLAYKQLYQALADPRNQYPDINTIAPILPDQVAKLLA